MAFSMGSSPLGGGRGSRFRGGNAPLAEINIIPLVDVVLVLLIIFMLTAHVMEFGLEVDVPKVKDEKTTTKELPVITINKQGEVYLNDKPANVNSLAADIKQRFSTTDGVFIRADKATPWEPIAQIASEMSKAQLKTSMVTQPYDGK